MAALLNDLRSRLEQFDRTQLIFTLILGCIILSLLVRQKRQPIAPTVSHSAKAPLEREPVPVRNFTIEQLHMFTGTNEQGEEDGDVPIFVALRGEVYDVSAAAHAYGKEGGYHLFAGHDASCNLAKMSFEESELDSMAWDSLNFSEKDALDNWCTTFRDYKGYPIVGKIVQLSKHEANPLPEITSKQLAAADGSQDTLPDGYAVPPIYVALSGKVFDVSFGGVEHYGPGCGYHLFAGRDASRSLAKMSFDTAHLDNPSTGDLSVEEQTVLADWVKKFEQKGYPVVGTYKRS